MKNSNYTGREIYFEISSLLGQTSCFGWLIRGRVRVPRSEDVTVTADKPK